MPSKYSNISNHAISQTKKTQIVNLKQTNKSILLEMNKNTIIDDENKTKTLMVEVNNNIDKDTKSNLSIVMDLIKNEYLTTTMKVRRSSFDAFEYSTTKQIECELDGVINESPEICDQIRENSVAREYIPQFIYSDHITSHQSTATQENNNRVLYYQSQNLNRKQKELLQKIREKTNDIITEVNI